MINLPMRTNKHLRLRLSTVAIVIAFRQSYPLVDLDWKMTGKLPRKIAAIPVVAERNMESAKNAKMGKNQ